MSKLINRIKYWLFVRRYHIEGLRFETNEDGYIDVIAEIKGKRVVIHLLSPDGTVSEGVTDFGIAKSAQRVVG